MAPPPSHKLLEQVAGELPWTLIKKLGVFPASCLHMEVLAAEQAMDMEDTNIARQMFRVFDMEPWLHQQVKWIQMEVTCWNSEP